MASGKKAIKKYDYFTGTVRLNVPKSGMEVNTYMKDGMSKFYYFKINYFLVDDWDCFEKMLDYLYKDCLIAESAQHSVLFTEPAVFKLN